MAFNQYDDHQLADNAVRFVMSLIPDYPKNLKGECSVCRWCEDCNEFEHCVFCYHKDYDHEGVIEFENECDTYWREYCEICSEIHYWRDVDSDIDHSDCLEEN